MIAALAPGWLGVSSLVFYAWLLLGRPGLASLALAQLAVLAPVIVASLRGVAAPPAPNGADVLRTPPGMRAILGLAVAAAALAALHVVRAYPDGMWMAIDIWNGRAAYLAETDLGAMLASAPWHKDYPLLLPLSIGELWAFAGRTRLVPVAIGLGLTTCSALLLYGAARRSAGPLAAAAVTTALLASPWFVVHGAGQLADVPLACFALGGAVLLWEHDRSPGARPGLLVWAGVLLGCAMWTKNEGLLLALAILGVRTLRRRDGLGQVLAGALPFVLALTHHRLTCGEVSDLVEGQGEASLARLLDPARYATTARAFATEGAGYVVAAGLLVWLLPAGARALLLGLRVPALVLAGYFAVYLLTPLDLAFHLESTLVRLLLHVWPLALLAIGLACAPGPEPAAGSGYPPGDVPGEVPT